MLGVQFDDITAACKTITGPLTQVTICTIFNHKSICTEEGIDFNNCWDEFNTKPSPQSS